MSVDLKESIVKSIEKKLLVLDEEEKSLTQSYKNRMSIYNDGFYANIARNKALREANNIQSRLDAILWKKLLLLKEIKELD